MEVSNAKTSGTELELERDIRLDACRGLAQWFILLDHVPGNIGSWLTLRPYGFSDTSEVFVFVSGVTCALAYGKVRSKDGWLAVVAHTLRRSWEIYVAFLILTIACVVVVHLAGSDRLADDSNTNIFLQNPGAALAHAAILQYRPVNTDVLPVFVLYHLLFAPLLWLLFRLPNVTLALSALLYLLVQIYGWNIPQWPRNDWYFNPFAWQLLVVLGAWWVTSGRKGHRFWITSRVVAGIAVAYLLFSLVVVLSWNFDWGEDRLPQWLIKLIYPIQKPDLDPLRLLHFLALAVVVSQFVRPQWQVFASPVLRAAVRCGENSLEVYCFGVLLTLAAQWIAIKVPGSVALQVMMSAGGILLMIAFATVLTELRIKSRQHPKLF